MTSSKSPPAVSAIKIGGRPAYELQRRGQTPELKPRLAKVYWIHLHAYAWPELGFEMACGRGTYVRAVIRDLGESLGTGGCLTALTRTAVGPFRIAEAWSPEALQETPDPERYLVPLEQARTLLVDRPVEIPGRPHAGA